MPDYSRDYSISHDTDAKSCTIRFRCFDTPNSVTVYGFGNDEDAESALLDVRRKCLELHLLWSFSLVGSEISRINNRGRRIEVGFVPRRDDEHWKRRFLQLRKADVVDHPVERAAD